LELEEQAAMPLAGGLMNHGYQCGMLWGATLAGGAQAYRLFGPGPQAETATILAGQRLAETFGARNNNEINCLEITHMNMQGRIQISKLLKFLIKGGPVICLRMIVGYAPDAFRDINSALSGKHNETISSPISCAAMLAQKMGASDMHAVMAAGFAGGIGLSGGACGALGTAIWINSMNSIKEGASNKVINSRASDSIERFLKSASDFKFECSEIVGRKFENVSDHADYLRNGGCSKIIEVLATTKSTG